MKRPSRAASNQQAAAWCVGTEALITERSPSSAIWYDDAVLPGASETKTRFSLPTSKPKGVAPTDWKVLASVVSPSSPITNVSIKLVIRSVTIKASPSREKETCAGPVLAALKERVE